MQNSERTKEFYDDLLTGNEKRGVLGKDKRFGTDKIINKNIVNKYFTDVIRDYIDKDDDVLDYGCGPGAFLFLTSQYSKSIIGIDITKGFVEECKDTISKYKIDNAQAIQIEPSNTGFENNQFDKIIMVDVIHHIEDIEKELFEIHRILKPNGKLIVFEPNKLNPLMFFWHLFDKNERGLLRVGSPKKYKRILNPLFKGISIRFSGLIVGPDSFIFNLLSNILNNKYIYPLFGWLNPKIFFVAEKR